MTGTQQLLVVPDGETKALIDEALRLAELLEKTNGGEISVVAVATDGIVGPDELTDWTPDEILSLGRERGTFETGAAAIEARVRALETVVECRDPAGVLLPGSADGNEISARLASGVRGAALVDGLLRVSHGELIGGRPAFGGRAYVEYEFERNPVVASLAVEGLSRPDDRPDVQPARTDRTVEVDDEPGIKRLDEVETPEDDIARARRIVAGGNGLDDPDGFDVIQELADGVDGTLGASRPPVDAGWLPYGRQIGVTGKEVDAELYVPCAISGDPYHMDAVEADTIVAVNEDPDARIFEFADLGIVGDIYEYGPVIAEAVRTAREEGTSEAVRTNPEGGNA
jgi:electron transfer flavoprotein alpha subunit